MEIYHNTYLHIILDRNKNFTNYMCLMILKNVAVEVSIS